MKKIFIFVILTLGMFISVKGQVTLPFVEHFDYALGNLQTVGSPNWTRISGTSDDLNVVDGNLTYTNYPMDATGRKIQIQSVGADDLKLTFTSQDVDGVKIYASFIVNIENGTGLGTTGVYFASLGSGNGTYGTRLWIADGSIDGGNFKLGISKGTNTVAGWTGDLNFGQNYLVVIYYEFNATADIVKLWVNPDLSGPEPSAVLTSSAGTNNSSIDGFYFRQTSGTPNASIDALRIALDWSQAPLPVELTTFTANILSDGVQLNWQTATEVNNYGFDVQRSTSSDNWITLGFIPGNGNSNSPKEYSFVDEEIKNQPNGKYYYRLKQIDTDGSESYSLEIEVEWANGVTDVNDDNNLPKEFSLSQNYPNPFNPTTKIKYAIPTVGNQNPVSVKLKVYDILGNEISTLVNEVKTPGEYEVEFSGKGLSSGMYFYKIEAGNFVQVKKMIMLK